MLVLWWGEGGTDKRKACGLGANTTDDWRVLL